MRRLHPPTLAQWGCDHRWKTTTSRPGEGQILRVRYLVCRRCGLRVKTEERLAVPWDENNLLDQAKALLPEGQAVALWDKGITELPLAWLNIRLASRGYAIHASNRRDLRRQVACTGADGRVEHFGLFELRQASLAPPYGHDRGNSSQSVTRSRQASTVAGRKGRRGR